MSQSITPELVSLDEPLGADKAAVIRALAARVAAQGRATDPEALFQDAWAREQKDETGLPGGIAIPHAKSAAVTQPSLAFARLAPGVDFGAPDGPADLVFLIAAPDGAAEAHLAVLSKLARSLMQDDFTAGLRAASTADEVVAIVRDAIGEGEAAPAASVPAPATAAAAPAASPVDAGLRIDGRPARIVAVTACATGIAHTFMAADALTAAGKKDGVDLVVEPQGSSGYQALPQEVIDNADAVIFATDVDVREQQRFAGKPVVRSGVKRGIEQPSQMIGEAVAAAKNPNAARVSGTAGAAAAASTAHISFGARIQRILLTGVSYMIPFVAGGGLLIALGFLLGGYEVTTNASTIITQNSLWDLPTTDITSDFGPLGQYLGSVFFMIGATSMGFLVSALAGYISFAIADRPGIAPGFVAGAVAVLMNAGFIGGIVGGLLAGVVAWWLGRLPAPRWLRGLMPVVIIPLVGSIVASGLLVLFLGRPIATLMQWLTDWLTSLTESGGAAIGLGIILGLMMCFDLGGPVNKVAYSFAVAGLAAGSADNPAPLLIMGAVMCAGMVPPLAMALASTILARKLFTPEERENGKAAWLLGASFISEGAIPFAAADPLRVIPASMVGGAVTGALCFVFNVQSYAPHGGIFVLFAIQPIWGFLVALIAGVLVSAFLVVGFKRFIAPKELAEAETPFEAPATASSGTAAPAIA
ncbi:PTS fructose transporter subunit IIABC [Microbacterium pygmaeum]|uniref:PTS system D-fructose-specific IIA component (F1P-forming), Frc family /PTS system D-fructose-specific IIB component (F1P-forming), Frc family /PTS system D-fructose-specific IIC component (F1P-for... n=1 Tax=Microbacterium pygmaeum TaxID=370764 RepID=A0A1G7ZXT1_9MICO|nr:fructose-specific PTS transporter subunit EIIC [Microbacterium pygmaeum]SDH13453.1 PTS system D-fructose-specific IIA component (F1P-forming), Frc family /PTS system D-fructose-specific IIB component (F1P-forming), Frc family /PTS system D-fructose-specific IIC component (F1P-forming), Frc family [Microbacterium pygmaeum]